MQNNVVSGTIIQSYLETIACIDIMTLRKSFQESDLKSVKDLPPESINLQH